MIKEDVKHIFDRSACLTKKQIETYLAGNMITEEVYAVEHHINGCPLCSMALDGMQLRKDALEVVGQLNANFLQAPLDAAAQPAQSATSAYLKNLKPKEVAGKPLMTGLKLLGGIAACAGILWFVQKASKDKAPETNREEEVVTVATAPQTEEQSVVVEEPLMAETPTEVVEEPVPQPQPVTSAPATAQPAVTTPAPTVKIGPPPPADVKKPTVPPATTAKTPVPAKPAPVTAAKPVLTPPLKPNPVATPPPVVREEEPRPQPVAKQEEPRPQPKEEPKPPPPPPKKEEAEELPSDPLAAGRALMEKRNYNAAIGKMRNEMRSNNKARRQEAVMLVARCYQGLGNKERAKELLSSIVDEGGPEKKNAKKMMKEVDKEAKTE